IVASLPTATETPGRFWSTMAARTSARARSTAPVCDEEGAGPLTDGTSVGPANSGTVAATARVRAPANSRMATPTTRAVRHARTGSRLRAAFTASHVAAIITINA